MAGLDPAGTVGSGYQIGELFQFTCPDCTGPLLEIRDGKLLWYRCRVGRAYTAEGVLEEKAEALESALYAALNTLEESAPRCRGRWPPGRASTSKATQCRASRNGPEKPESR